jgi:hypothetical protein
VVRVEAGKSVYTGTLAALQQALGTAGVIFVPENGEGPGVRMRKQRGEEGDGEDRSPLTA